MTDFVFPGMTPELQAYLGCGLSVRAFTAASWPLVMQAKQLSAADPTNEDLKLVAEQASKEHYERLGEFNAEIEQMRAALPSGLLKSYNDAHKAWLCRDETIVDSSTKLSPSGRYRLEITRHQTGPNTWACSRGKVYEGDRLIATINRNYSAFPYTFVENHPRGDFLVCGEDYQSSTVVDLKTGRIITSHVGFCWAKHHISPSKMTLAVEGCYWACPYEVWAIDFSDPMASPLPVLLKGSEAESFGEWTGPDSFTYGHRYEVYLPYNKRYDELTEEEEEAVDRREAAGEKVIQEIYSPSAEWKRPLP